MRHLIEKTASVMVADPVASVRLMMTSALRALGFSNVIAVPSLTETVSLIGREPVDWLITSFFADEKVNALHMLALARQHPQLNKMLVSMCVSDQELGFIPRAFALGAFSWHAKPFQTDGFTSSIEGILATLNRTGGDPTFVAADFLRAYLKDHGDPDTLIAFETAMCRKYPESPAHLLPLAESYFLLGDSQRGRSLLWEAEQREPQLAAQTGVINERYADVSTVVDQWRELALGVCVAIDSDSAVLQTAKDIFTSCGAKDVVTFSDGQAAWDWLRSNEPPDVVVMEWRIPKVSGPVLLQRLRAHGLHLPSVIVNSSLVKRKDEPLLKEMGVATILEKPTKRENFLNSLSWVVTQSRRPTEAKSLEEKIRALLKAGKFDDAARSMQLLVSKSAGDAASEAVIKTLEAEFAFHTGDYIAARDLAMTSLQLGGKSIIAMNLLGKTLMQLRDFSTALQVFDRATELSPDSIERLCATAETQCALGDDSKAMTTLDKATKIDGENQAVINSTVNIGLATGNAELTDAAFDRVKPSESVLAYINNRAVAHAKAGAFKESIKLYKNALEAMPTDKKQLSAILLYNLALAQVRDDDVKGAVTSLQSISTIKDPNLDKKVRSLLERGREAEQSGTKLKLNVRDSQEQLMSGAVQGTFSKLAPTFRSGEPDAKPAPTSLCLHGIFKERGPSSALVDAMAANPPRVIFQQKT